MCQVAFDPLDGSSIVGANFAVGAIFGIWPGRRLLGVTSRQQAAAAYAVYGPRTTLVLASPGNTCSSCRLLMHFAYMGPADTCARRPCNAGTSGRTVVQEFTLGQHDAKGVWKLTRDNITIGEKKARRLHALQTQL